MLSTLLFASQSFASAAEEKKTFPPVTSSNLSCFVENEKIQANLKTSVQDPYCCEFTHDNNQDDAQYRPFCLKQKIEKVEVLLSALKTKVEVQEKQLRQVIAGGESEKVGNMLEKKAYNFCPHWAKDADGNVSRHTAELTRYLTCLDSQYTSYQRYLSTVQAMQKTFAKKERKK
ncbi:MAG: hypothetical protein COV43_02150 [Deltaproteobacteria bacterium CG11_big_fil_rev_8_21_14_0_20_42_23]|nr:MAG: hypothetical protein COV43_02150 [Deltaproteobacteria bacterium CG11_big_fil_rev_8_21_14_0_20_42_23]PJC64732.1 MAG: hypothetical protein CO021_02685 [Deltaproteobacteria bacterium CG_4_9_14_0_2_um_filter_42_21]